MNRIDKLNALRGQPVAKRNLYDRSQAVFDLLTAGGISRVEIADLCDCSYSYVTKKAREWRAQGHVFPGAPPGYSHAAKIADFHISHGTLANGGDIWVHCDDKAEGDAEVMDMGGELNAR